MSAGHYQKEPLRKPSKVSREIYKNLFKEKKNNRKPYKNFLEDENKG